jgi:site-specific DNA-methyltransferase (adenine-specific)
MINLILGILERRRKGGDLRDPKSYKRKLDDPTVKRFKNIRDFSSFTKNWLQCAIKFVKPSAPLIIWTNPLGKAPTIELCNDLDYSLTGEYIWAKRTVVLSKDEILKSTKNEVLLRVYETALVFNRKKLGNIEVDPSHPAIPWSCISGYHDTPSSDPMQRPEVHEHPCHKPKEVIDPLIRTWTNPNDLILDCFVGSGGIPISAASLHRRVYGIEYFSNWVKYTQSELDKVSNAISRDDSSSISTTKV